MISMSKASLTGVIAAFIVAAVLIAGCTSTTSPNTPQTQTAGTGGGTNQLPIANAGANQTGKAGTVVTLDGRGSGAPGGGALTYSWSFSSAPKNSTARLVNNTSDRVTFTPDKAGTYVVSLVVKDGAGRQSTPDTTNVTVIPAERLSTTLIINDTDSKTDVYLGDQVKVTGRLVDADGNGIPNQTIHFKNVARVLGFTHEEPINDATTDSTGAFTMPYESVTRRDAPSFIKTVEVEAWAVYDGSDLYKPSSTPHKHLTVHLN
ncbi:MAG: PKD domain-containing protein [Euryarchaeota archaeon]|nr:PKD domain-containing protein [Euryarchaeota archaeon]